MNKTELSKHFKISRKSLDLILSNKEKIMKAIEQGGSAKRARLKPGKHDEMESALVL